MNKRLAISVNETCDALGLGRTKVYELIKSKKLVSKKVGNRRLILIQSVTDFLASQVSTNHVYVIYISTQ